MSCCLELHISEVVMNGEVLHVKSRQIVRFCDSVGLRHVACCQAVLLARYPTREEEIAEVVAGAPSLSKCSIITPYRVYATLRPSAR